MSKKFRDNRNFKKHKRDTRNLAGKFYHTKDFRQLQSEWYNKLSDEGFKDIEHFNIEFVHSQDSGFMKGRNPKKEAKLLTQNPYQFYRVLSIFSHSQSFYAQFDPKWHKFNTFLLQNYANGASYRDLASLVKIEILDKCDRHGKSPDYPAYLKSRTPIFYRMKEIIDSAIAWYDSNDELE